MMGPGINTPKHVPYFAAQDTAKKTTISPRIQKIGRITQNAELIKLIESACESDKINIKKIYEQISPEEVWEFIFKTKGKFLEDAVQDLGFRCLEFLKELCLNSDDLGSMFDGRSTISTLLVLQLNKSQLPHKEKRRLLSTLFDLNEKGLREIVDKVGNSQTDAILTEIERRAAKEEEMEEEMEEELEEGKYNFSREC